MNDSVIAFLYIYKDLTVRACSIYLWCIHLSCHPFSTVFIIYMRSQHYCQISSYFRSMCLKLFVSFNFIFFPCVSNFLSTSTLFSFHVFKTFCQHPHYSRSMCFKLMSASAILSFHVFKTFCQHQHYSRSMCLKLFVSFNFILVPCV